MTETMKDEGFRAALHARVEAARDRERGDQRAIEAEMRARLDLEQDLRKRYGPLHLGVIHPTVEAIAAAFDNTTITHWALPRGFVSRCQLGRSPQFAATATLTIGMEWGETDSVWVTSERRVTPVHPSFEETERLDVNGHEPDRAAIRAWLETRVMGFVDACLAIAGDAFYRGGTTRTDPVCGMEVRVEGEADLFKYEGRGYAFCSSACRSRFEQDPDMYVGQGKGAGHA